ncbi:MULTISPECIES: hypothetical protein [Bradyrhizobium]|uniref:Uncharacterized protein n=1 Tax=Bradyrhizobium elkanii TaxID=29448 RepID=A0A8I1XZU2_BRAEL|nr:MULTISPECIES: hypothetical protein [Bradyrhizobium]MBP1290998.1 hypothetical protein [Bradyrhizobium elkanii]MCP1928687.1 hypothetical protein [Bradyrhizobium elkanii]MCS3473991.1 hypothetical protein [Bradyrhizobium elkanii]MCS3580698.1 hypothetical protein [Bradyrhizobium elkanii]MCS3723574.1 hypothetical protein [Bradyrhizobium elkanii]
MVEETRAQHSGIHRSVHYTIIEGEAAGTWRYSFSVRDRNFSGTVQAVLGLLAARRVRMKIDRVLRQNASIDDQRSQRPEKEVETAPPLDPPADPKD